MEASQRPEGPLTSKAQTGLHDVSCGTSGSCKAVLSALSQELDALRWSANYASSSPGMLKAKQQLGRYLNVWERQARQYAEACSWCKTVRWTLRKCYSNLIAMVSTLVAMASNLIAMASNLNGLQPHSDGLQPNSDGLHPYAAVS